MFLRTELRHQVMSGDYSDSFTEVGRSSSQQLLEDPHLSLEVVMKILAKRGKLTNQELVDYKASLPKTKRRIVFAPRRLAERVHISRV